MKSKMTARLTDSPSKNIVVASYGSQNPFSTKQVLNVWFKK